MGRRPLSSYPAKIAAKMRADIAERMRQAWKKREQNGLGSRKNGSLREEVKQRIAKSVKLKWQEGVYDSRRNGMSGLVGAKHPNWDWGKNHFRVILGQYQPPVCAFCGRKDSLNAHHVDEDHNNYLISNLQWACVPCHAWRFHYTDRSTRKKLPFVTIGKKFRFEYAHVLSWHPGKCSRMHGHSGKLTVRIRARVDPNGVVEDFYDVSAAVKTAVVEPLDHRVLNDFIPNPTSEELLIYVWRRLESIGLKGLSEVSFSETDSTFATITKADMIEAFGWNKTRRGKWVFIRKENSV